MKVLNKSKKKSCLPYYIVKLKKNNKQKRKMNLFNIFRNFVGLLIRVCRK